jgi:hypothetical protein
MVADCRLITESVALVDADGEQLVAMAFDAGQYGRSRRLAKGSPEMTGSPLLDCRSRSMQTQMPP